jgi:hypothetical protein
MLEDSMENMPEKSDADVAEMAALRSHEAAMLGHFLSWLHRDDGSVTARATTPTASDRR